MMTVEERVPRIVGHEVDLRSGIAWQLNVSLITTDVDLSPTLLILNAGACGPGVRPRRCYS
jgi:hypothetical protein